MNQNSEKADMEPQEGRELLYQLPNGEIVIIETHANKKVCNWEALVEYYIKCKKFSGLVHII